MMGKLHHRDPTVFGNLRDHLAALHDDAMEEESQVSAELARIEKRFLEGELLTLSGSRKGQPLTRQERRLLWDRMQSLCWQQARLLDTQSRLYRLADGWRPELDRVRGE